MKITLSTVAQFLLAGKLASCAAVPESRDIVVETVIHDDESRGFSNHHLAEASFEANEDDPHGECF